MNVSFYFFTPQEATNSLDKFKYLFSTTNMYWEQRVKRHEMSFKAGESFSKLVSPTPTCIWFPSPCICWIFNVSSPFTSHKLSITGSILKIKSQNQKLPNKIKMLLVLMTNLPSLKEACIPEFNIAICKDGEISVKLCRRMNQSVPIIILQ